MKNIRIIFLLSILSLFLFISCSGSSASVVEERGKYSVITVTGTGQMDVEPDVGMINIGVRSQGSSVVDAIAINTIDAKAVVTAIKAANRADVPVFMHNLITPVDKGEVVEYIGYDQWSGAAKLAKYTCDLLDGEGEVFILMGIPGFHTNRRTQGYRWGLAQWCPSVTVMGAQTAEWEREKAVNVATMALQQHPGIDLFYGNSDEMGIGACIAAEKMGRKINKDIWCVSIDGNDVTLDLIEEGKTTATLGVYPNLMGGVIIQQMEKVLKGTRVPYILETPSIVVDITNVADYRSGSTWTLPVEGVPELDNGLPSGEYADH